MTRARDYLGPYRLVRLIRAGQTCQVWDAISDVDKSRVALKALQPEVRNDKEEIEYLKHEFAVGKDLDHVNVIHIYEFSTDRRVPYLVMELSMGQNMKLMMREDLELMHFHADKIIKESALGLQYLHDAGWVHRDVKPDNFLVNEDCSIKLIDFAIARKLKENPLAGLFGKRKIQGTRSYMSPEQIRGKKLDARSDIYSYGCLLYEMMTGRTPFTASTPEELLTKHIRAAVPTLVSHNSNVTADFNTLVMSMMAKKPQDRPESLSKFLAVFKTMRVFKSRPKPPEKKTTTEE